MHSELAVDSRAAPPERGLTLAGVAIVVPADNVPVSVPLNKQALFASVVFEKSNRKSSSVFQVIILETILCFQ